MKRFLLLILLCSCQDPDPFYRDAGPTPKELCARSCQERGGEFLLLTQEGYCYCAWYDGGAD